MIAVIADDFTGAAELAGAAAELGLSAEVQTRFDPSSDAQVIAVDTDTRALEESAAARIVADVARDIQRANPDSIYKKTDSVLRGNVRAEIEAILSVIGVRRCLLVPANPSKGRTIRDGIYLIDGNPLDQSTFANDPQHPRRSAKLADLLGHPITQIAPAEPAPREGIIVPDVETERDLSFRASECDSATLAAGAVEFFIAMLRAKAANRIPKAPHQERPLKTQRRLFVCGSAQAWSHDRPDECCRYGVTVHAMPEEVFSASNDASESATRQWAEMIAQSLKAENTAMAAIGREFVPSLSSTHAHADRLVEAVGAVVAKCPCDHLYIEGGSTAAALARCIGWTRFRALPAQLAGVACLQPFGCELPLLFVKPGSYPWPREVWTLKPPRVEAAG